MTDEITSDFMCDGGYDHQDNIERWYKAAKYNQTTFNIKNLKSAINTFIEEGTSNGCSKDQLLEFVFPEWISLSEKPLKRKLRL